MASQEGRYDHRTVESRWQQIWQQSKLDQVDIVAGKKPFYNLMMFPYPSAEGLHVGNMYAFTGSDIYGRFKRMQGYDVFEPIGLDGFGIHSENYALKIGRHPMEHAKITEKNFYNQLHKIGAMFDWSRTVETYDPDYYRWTQWIFVQMFKHGLAYRDKANVNWCPSDKTVLADEQVIDGKCERCGNIVEKRLLDQWFFRITAYAEKLLENLPKLDWSEKVKVAQKNWIGKKEGIVINYPIIQLSNNPMHENKTKRSIDVFTTRPDTNFGATFVVVAPEHPFVASLLRASHVKSVHSSELVELPENKRIEIATYVKNHAGLSEAERIAERREKTGVFTGLYCINQLTKYKMPLYISDFVVMGVGTGAVVGVPGHDIRDFEFAKAFDLPIVRVVVGKDGDTSPITKIEQVQEEEGTMIHSGFLNGLDIHAATEEMIFHLEEKGWGKRVTTYHLRDWLISRQRYWGPPIPMIYCKKCAKEGKSWFTSKESQRHPGSIQDQMLDKTSMTGQVSMAGPARNASHSDAGGWYPVPEDQLPVELPYIEDYKPGDDGIAPLAKHKEFYETTCPGCGANAVRETDVSDTFLDSSWYFLRYPSMGPAKNSSFWQAEGASRIKDRSWTSQDDGQNFSPSPRQLPWDLEITKRWLPVHMYTGGAEHAVLHLLYSRFIWKCFYDWGYFDFSAQGGPASGWEEPFTRFYAHGLVIKDGAKMSKSKGNVINPDEYIETYGSDALRLYLMFMGPFSDGGDFRDTAMEGMSRWVRRIWRIAMQSIEAFHPRGGGIAAKGGKGHLGGVSRALQKLIKKVTEDIERRHYNTAIAAMMEFTNLVDDQGGALAKDELATFLKLLAPFAPYLAEELWFRLHAEVSHDSSFWQAEGASRIKNRSWTSQDDGKTAHQVDLSWSIHLQSWPTYDARQVTEETVEILIQVDGKLRDKLSIARDKSHNQKEVERLALISERVGKFLEGKSPKKTIFVPGRLINFVI